MCDQCRCNFGKPPNSATRFGVKAAQVKGYSSLTKQDLIKFYIINGIDVPMNSTKDKLYSSLKKIYSSLTPTDIKMSVNTNDTIANIMSTKQRQKEAEEKAKKEILEEKERLKRAQIKKITYSPRNFPREFDTKSKRLPAGSKSIRYSLPVVRADDIDSLTDAFSSVRYSYSPVATGTDDLSGLLSGLRVNNKFGG